MIRTIEPRVHAEALLRELPRFFSSPEAVLKELLQNAIRAGASNCTVTTDGPRITFQDDGSGCPDPAVLLNAGDSGWTGVTEPAGLGALSTLNPALTSRVTFASRDWTFTVTPGEFQALLPVAVQARREQPGFMVSVEFCQPQDFTGLMYAARGYAPLTVTLDGRALPPRQPEGTRYDTAAGTLYLHSSRGSVLIWEGFPIAAEALHQVTRASLSGLAAALLDRFSLTLVADAQTHIRPKLPDRNAVRADLGLSLDATLIAAEVQRLAAELVARVPQDRDIVTREEAWAALQGHPLIPEASDYFMQQVQEAAGFSLGAAAGTDDSTWIEMQDDAQDDNFGRQERFTRSTLTTGCSAGQDAMLSNLKEHGLSVPYGSPALPGSLELTASGQVEISESLKTVSRLTLKLPDEQVLSVPWAIKDQQILLAGTREQAEETLLTHAQAIGAALLHARWEEGDYRSADITPDWEDDETCTFYPSDVVHALYARLIQALFPERAGGLEERDAHARLAEAISGAVQLSHSTVASSIDVLKSLRTQHQAAADALTLTHPLPVYV